MSQWKTFHIQSITWTRVFKSPTFPTISSVCTIGMKLKKHTLRVTARGIVTRPGVAMYTSSPSTQKTKTVEWWVWGQWSHLRRLEASLSYTVRTCLLPTKEKWMWKLCPVGRQWLCAVCRSRLSMCLKSGPDFGELFPYTPNCWNMEPSQLLFVSRLLGNPTYFISFWPSEKKILLTVLSENCSVKSWLEWDLPV